MTEANQASINIFPIDLGKVFPATGGLPLPKRAPARQAYRMQELKRWRKHTGVELVLEPKYFPTSDKLAAAMVVNLRSSDPAAAVRFAGACLRACWAEERDISDESTLRTIADEQQLDANALLTDLDAVREIIANDSEKAIERGIFGAPSYVYEDHLFWGQDRLDFLHRLLNDS